MILVVFVSLLVLNRLDRSKRRLTSLIYFDKYRQAVIKEIEKLGGNVKELLGKDVENPAKTDQPTKDHNNP